MKILKLIKMSNIIKVLKMINVCGYSFKVSKVSISNTQGLLTLSNAPSGTAPGRRGSVVKKSALVLDPRITV